MMGNEEEHLLGHGDGRSGMSFRLAFSFFACTIGSSFQFGYNTGVVNPPETTIEDFLNETSVMRTGEGMSGESVALWWSGIVSIWIVGGMIGGLSGGVLADKFGRKGSLLMSNTLVILGGLLMFASKYSYSGVVLAAGRFFAGLHSGVSTCVAPMYLSEVAPLSWRGFAGVFHQMTIIMAILISQVLGLDFIMGNREYWHFLLGLVVVPAVLQLLLYPWCPESPRYLYLHQHRKDKALQALQWLHGAERAVSEMRLIEVEKETTQHLNKMSVWDLLRSSSLRFALIISIVLQISQQLTGINAVNYYSTRFFEDAGLTHAVAQYATIGSSAVNFIMTVIAAFLMDWVGRRTLQLLGLGGEWVFAILITISFVTSTTNLLAMRYISIAAVFGFVVSFALGPGSIPWFMVAELFTQNQRGAAVSIAVFVNWLCNFIVGISFPSMERALGGYSFIPFIIILTLVWIFLYLRLPETKNRSVAEVNAQIRGGSPQPPESLPAYDTSPD